MRLSGGYRLKMAAVWPSETSVPLTIQHAIITVRTLAYVCLYKLSQYLRFEQWRCVGGMEEAPHNPTPSVAAVPSLVITNRVDRVAPRVDLDVTAEIYPCPCWKLSWWRKVQGSFDMFKCIHGVPIKLNVWSSRGGKPDRHMCWDRRPTDTPSLNTRSFKAPCCSSITVGSYWILRS